MIYLRNFFKFLAKIMKNLHKIIDFINKLYHAKSFSVISV